MKRKLIIAAAIVVFVLTGTAIITELTRKTQPPEFVFPTLEAVSEESVSEEPLSEEAPSASAETAKSSNVTTETSEEQNALNVLYTSHDPLHYFRLTFDGDTITVDGVYEGNEVTRVALSSRNSVKPQYNGDHMTAVLQTDGDPEQDRLDISLSAASHIPVYIWYDENGLPQPLITEALQRSTLALAHPITIPQAAVSEYVLTGGSAEERAEVLAQVKDISDRVCEGLDSDYDKARALAAWVSKNIFYDYVAFETEVTVETLSLSRTLELQRSVCGGFANLYAALCQAQGITCHVVKGTVIQGGGTFAEGGHEAPSHEWNVAEIDGRHVWVDNLWNTTNGYDGDYYLGSQTYRYFDISDECMAINHRAERVEIREFY